MHAGMLDTVLDIQFEVYLIVVDELVFTGYSNGGFRFGASKYMADGRNIMINPHELTPLVKLITLAEYSAEVSPRLHYILSTTPHYIRLNHRRRYYTCSTLLDNWPIFVDQIRAELY